jgi:hypothetical protein
MTDGRILVEEDGFSVFRDCHGLALDLIANREIGRCEGKIQKMGLEKAGGGSCATEKMSGAAHIWATPNEPERPTLTPVQMERVEIAGETCVHESDAGGTLISRTHEENASKRKEPRRQKRLRQ